MTGVAVVLDRAIFTSVRSPMGTGYKVVAASAGVTDDEKREITQRAPSHGNLCDETPDARAFACFTLRSGRQCFLLSRHNGPEPSGRGGFKIHTDVLVMNAADFRHFCFNPSRVMNAADRIVEVDASAPGTLNTLSLPYDMPPVQRAVRDEEADCVLMVLAALLEGRTVAVTGAPDSATLLCDVLCALPAGRRMQLACGCGLKVSKQRNLDLAFVDCKASLGMLAHDPKVVTIDWRGQSSPKSTCYEAWLAYVRKAWRGCRVERLVATADALVEESTPEALNVVAFLESKIPTVELLNPSGLESLSDRLRELNTTGPIQRRLYAEISDLIQRRWNAFTPKEPDAADTNTVPAK